MSKIELTEVVKRIVGDIKPVGDSSIDHKRLENLKSLFELINGLVHEVRIIHIENMNSQQYSVKIASDLSEEFINNLKKE